MVVSVTIINWTFPQLPLSVLPGSSSHAISEDYGPLRCQMQVLFSERTDIAALPLSLILRKFWLTVTFSLLTVRVGPALSFQCILKLLSFFFLPSIQLQISLVSSSARVLCPSFPTTDFSHLYLSLFFFINRLYLAGQGGILVYRKVGWKVQSSHMSSSRFPLLLTFCIHLLLPLRNTDTVLLAKAHSFQ